jgi:hypothetical protein
VGLALVVLLGAGTAAAEGLDGGIFLPGTQPNELTLDIRPPDLCKSCHGGYSERSANDSWSGSMMANAARDPLFQAALTIANQDVPGSGDVCIRCHSPRAWLFGRSSPPLISGFEPDDFEGVSCDFCHRLTTGPSGQPLIGTGQYYVADDYVRRGPLKDAVAPHDWEYSSYFTQSRLCGLCHDVSNPLNGNFAIERTYTEWLSSSFPAERKSCQTCHLPGADGKACGAPGMPDRTLHAHELAGGNTWMPRVLAAEHPELERDAAYERTAKAAEAKLKSAAKLSIDAPSSVAAGEKLPFSIRVENLTGHKLPTGYPEGRRCWLEVVARGPDGATLLHSGGYDVATATRSDDPDLRTYEVRMAAKGKEGFHFILQDELLQDNRIPPRGFVPRPDTVPVGRVYPEIPGVAGGPATLAHGDDAPYQLDVPPAVSGTLSIEVTLWYQTTSLDYVTALRDENVTDDAGERLYALWQKYARAEPFAMASAHADVLLIGETTEPPPDAGPDASLGGGPIEPAGGCGCRLSARYRPTFGDRSAPRMWWCWLGLVLGLARRRRSLHL